MFSRLHNFPQKHNTLSAIVVLLRHQDKHDIVIS